MCVCLPVYDDYCKQFFIVTVIHYPYSSDVNRKICFDSILRLFSDVY